MFSSECESAMIPVFSASPSIHKPIYKAYILAIVCLYYSSILLSSFYDISLVYRISVLVLQSCVLHDIEVPSIILYEISKCIVYESIITVLYIIYHLFLLYVPSSIPYLFVRDTLLYFFDHGGRGL